MISEPGDHCRDWAGHTPKNGPYRDGRLERGHTIIEGYFSHRDSSKAMRNSSFASGMFAKNVETIITANKAEAPTGAKSTVYQAAIEPSEIGRQKQSIAQLAIHKMGSQPGVA